MGADLWLTGAWPTLLQCWQVGTNAQSIYRCFELSKQKFKKKTLKCKGFFSHGRQFLCVFNVHSFPKKWMRSWASILGELGISISHIFLKWGVDRLVILTELLCLDRQIVAWKVKCALLCRIWGLDAPGSSALAQELVMLCQLKSGQLLHAYLYNKSHAKVKNFNVQTTLKIYRSLVYRTGLLHSG